ncbi:MAG: glycoside hydrolase family 9 protein [Anaerolineae bacterium]
MTSSVATGLNFSFVSGYRTNAMRHPHHRFWADHPAINYPPVPPGALAGGPNANPADPPAQSPEIASRPTAKRYIDDLGSYSTNEVAISWNASLAWVAAFLDGEYGA